MNSAEFQLQGVGDPRLAIHATSALPAWLWSTDGTRILWANPVGARLFGAANGASLARKTFSPADSHRRQVARLADRLPLNGALRLERLRGFGSALGMLVTCGCARLEFSDGSQFSESFAILVAAAEPVGRAMPLAERLKLLVEGIDTPIAAFARDGTLVSASDAAHPLLGFRNLSEAGLDEARREALKQGRVETPFGIGHMMLQRVGTGADVALVALIAPAAVAPALIAADQPISDHEKPVLSGEVPVEFALIDEFAEPPMADIEDIVSHHPSDSGPQPASQLDASDLEAAGPETPAEAVTSDVEIGQDEPSPYVEAVADEPTDAPTEAPSGLDEPAPEPRRHPLRFIWQIDAEGRFSLGTDEFIRLIGRRTAARLGRRWSEIAKMFGLDPGGRVAGALATGSTWSGITLDWPVDGGSRLPVELSGLPVYDHNGKLAGYRGFGVCRDLDGLTQMAALRHHELLSGTAALDMPAVDDDGADLANATSVADLSAADLESADLQAADLPGAASSDTPEQPTSIASETSSETDLDTPVETPKNVLPFRPISDAKALTSVENSAFNEIARQLAARLDSEHGGPATSATSDAPDAVVEQPAAPQAPEQVNEQPNWLARPEPPARGEARDKALLDLLPVGVLIYRLDRLLYANPAFLERMGYRSLHALEEAGGLDALYVEPGVSSASSTSDTGTPVTICASETSAENTPASANEARLFTISWDGDSALALIFSGSSAPAAAIADVAPASQPSDVGHANAEELGAILDTAAEGVMMFDAEGNINSCNRSAEALFGYGGAELVQRNLADLFAPESQRVVRDYLDSIKGAGFASLLDHGRDVLGRVREGGLIPLSMTMGRTRPDGPNFFAVFRDRSQRHKSEGELQQAQRLADRAANAKADMLARISHEVRTPLNAIIGFAEVMIGGRFGALANERYAEYMKDIRASGERVITIINDLLDLSRIETGKLDLAFANQNLNDLVEQCVAVMQPQANRERIIIRTSLAPLLPPVIADARALRQITLNLIGNSIHLANTGGQVIVSTALSDFGEVVLRVRDTGQGLNNNELAAAMEPFRTAPPSDQASENAGVSLSLTKALVEANRAQFQIKTGPHSGTLVEVVFPYAMARA